MITAAGDPPKFTSLRIVGKHRLRGVYDACARESYLRFLIKLINSRMTAD